MLSGLVVFQLSGTLERKRSLVSSFREMLSLVKQGIVEIDPAAAAALMGQALFLDVREADEYVQGALPGAVHLPRGMLVRQV
jgi:hypothetical protein